MIILLVYVFLGPFIGFAILWALIAACFQVGELVALVTPLRPGYVAVALMMLTSGLCAILGSRTSDNGPLPRPIAIVTGVILLVLFLLLVVRMTLKAIVG